MSKMQGLEQALKNSSGKAVMPQSDLPPPAPRQEASRPARSKAPREGKKSITAWLKPDFGISLRLVQLRRTHDVQGNKIFLDDLIAEALNDLFLKYDVPTVHHE